MTHLPRIQLQATEIDPNTVRPGWVALLIVLALGAATVLLWRNMGKQLKKIDFDDPTGGQPVPPDEPVDDPAQSADRPTPPNSRAQAGDVVPTPPHHPGQGQKDNTEDPAHH